MKMKDQIFEDKKILLLSLLSDCEIISTDNYKKNTLCQMKIDMFNNMINESTEKNIDNIAYQVIKFVDDFITITN